MRFLVLAAFVVIATGCGRLDRWFAGVTGNASEICYDGVTYLQFTSGSTVKYDKEGKIVTCDD